MDCKCKFMHFFKGNGLIIMQKAVGKMNIIRK